MSTANKSRILVKIVKELAEELDIRLDLYCHDWVMRLSKNGKAGHIMGYDWELNNAAAQLVAKDKAACYEILAAQGIPAIEHKLFLGPEYLVYTGQNAYWPAMQKYAERYNYSLVCKPNEGTGGNDLFRIDSEQQLEAVANDLFRRNRGISLCPFYDIDIEYRVIVLNGAVQLIFAKQKPAVTGNGAQTLQELINANYNAVFTPKFDLNGYDLQDVIPDRKIIPLGWKHNLAYGAKPVLVEDESLKAELSKLALQAMDVINIDFASVDIAACADGLRVMEINAGIMMENFAQESVQNYALAKKIYKNAIGEMLKI